MSARWIWFFTLAACFGAGAYGVSWAAEVYVLPQLLCVTTVLGLAAAASAWHALTIYIEGLREWDAGILLTKQNALARTPQTMLAEHMRQLHPKAIEVLALYGRMSWMVMPGADPDKSVTWVLYGTQVTYDFIAEFLQASNDTSCVPEWRFANDGAKHFAPQGMESEWPSDRDQYRQLIAYLYGMARVTMAHGNQPAQWIKPWKPETLAKAMGVKFEEEGLHELPA